MLSPHEGDAEELGGNEELGELVNVGKALGKNVGEAVGVFELLGAIDGIT